MFWTIVTLLDKALIFLGCCFSYNWKQWFFKEYQMRWSWHFIYHSSSAVPEVRSRWCILLVSNHKNYYSTWWKRMIYHAIRNIDHSKALYQKKNKILAIIDNMFWTMSILTFFVRLPNIRATGTAEKKLCEFLLQW